MGDQSVIYAAAAAIAQVGVIGVAVFAVKGFLGALDRFGVIANRAGKGLVDRASKKGSEMKENTAWRRGATVRKESRQARRTEHYARSGWRQAVAGGVPLPKKIAPGRAEDRAAVGRQAENIVTRHEAEQANIFAEQFRRAGTTSDGFLMERAKNGHSAAERRAAMTLLAENGRVKQLRFLSEGGEDPKDQAKMIHDPEDQRRLREVITGNSGRLYGKAPDLNPGNPAPFDGSSASDVASWHYSTVEKAIKEAQAQAAEGNTQLMQQLEQAYSVAMSTPSLRGNFTPESLEALQGAFPSVGTGPRSGPTPSTPSGGPELIVPRGTPSTPPPPAGGATPTQETRNRGGNFGGFS